LKTLLPNIARRSSAAQKRSNGCGEANHRTSKNEYTLGSTRPVDALPLVLIVLKPSFKAGSWEFAVAFFQGHS
jgi:hypothetical protein